MYDESIKNPEKFYREQAKQYLHVSYNLYHTHPGAQCVVFGMQYFSMKLPPHLLCVSVAVVPRVRPRAERRLRDGAFQYAAPAVMVTSRQRHKP
jgi:hypothetical protein